VPAAGSLIAAFRDSTFACTPKSSVNGLKSGVIAKSVVNVEFR
jgi:hypothetical protein